MPLYEYQCDACGRRFEVIQKFSDPPPESCKHCGQAPVRRLASSPAIQFKGSGWYVTDYAQKGKSDSTATAAPGTSDTTKTDGGTTTSEPGTAKSDTKSDAATPSATPSGGHQPATPKE